MRLKEEGSSWRAGAIKKRDFRHMHDDQPPNFKSNKDTNKWCRGKIGVLHEVNWLREEGLFGDVIYVGICRNCEKKLYRSKRPT